MTTYRVPVTIRGFVLVEYPDGKTAGDDVGGLPHATLLRSPPHVRGAPLQAHRIAFDGVAVRVDPQTQRPASDRGPLRFLRSLFVPDFTREA